MDVNTFYKCKIIEILIEQGLWPPDDMYVDAAYCNELFNTTTTGTRWQQQ